jgi:hypothetical protein
MRIMIRLCLLAPLLFAACGTSDESALDEQAIADGADGKADTYSFTRLDRVTPTQATAAFTARRGIELPACFDDYKQQFGVSPTMISKEIADKFYSVGSATDWANCTSDIGDIVEGILHMKGVTEATPTDIVAAMPAWAKPKFQSAAVGGYVEFKTIDLTLYDDLRRVRDAKAIEREKDPTGIDLGAIREQWKQVRDETTLDRAYLNPVTFPAGALDDTSVFKYLRAAFPLRGLRLQSAGFAAVSDFAQSYEGPDGDAEFAPIATAVRKTSIRKRFYFAGQGEWNDSPWSSNVLIVVDEHGQAWGMQMGYSE